MELAVSCESCKFFVNNPLQKDYGWCRRYPPTGHQADRVLMDYWCGEYVKTEDEKLLAELSAANQETLAKAAEQMRKITEPEYRELVMKDGIAVRKE